MCSNGCQNSGDGELGGKRTVGSGPEPQINKAAATVSHLLFWDGELMALCRGHAAAVTAHLMFVPVYFGLKIMSRKYTRLRKPSSTALHRDM